MKSNKTKLNFFREKLFLLNILVRHQEQKIHLRHQIVQEINVRLMKFEFRFDRKLIFF